MEGQGKGREISKHVKRNKRMRPHGVLSEKTSVRRGGEVCVCEGRNWTAPGSARGLRDFHFQAKDLNCNLLRGWMEALTLAPLADQ